MKIMMKSQHCKDRCRLQPDGSYHDHGDPLAMYNTDCDIGTEIFPVAT
ncbi:hypothetical protein [Thalassomonas sp. RHCl1]|nr:hypothetical protein [Thalassomonas sp. RHCl1]